LHFVNADNKQTVPRILRLYQDMGVRAAGIVNFDVLNDRTELAGRCHRVQFCPRLCEESLTHWVS